MMGRKIQLVFRGEGVSLSLADSHKVLCLPLEHLFSGLIFEESTHCSISIESAERMFLPDLRKVIYSAQEFVAANEWQSTKRLDWNHCINKWQDAEWACEIEVEEEFDERLLQYNVAHPISVRVGKKIYSYNRPVLTNLDYNGKTYSLTPIVRSKHTDGLMKKIIMTRNCKT